MRGAKEWKADTMFSETLSRLHGMPPLEFNVLPLFQSRRKPSKWVQFGMRKAGLGYNDDVYYEVENRPEGLQVQLHIRGAKALKKSNELRDFLCDIADQEKLKHGHPEYQQLKIVSEVIEDGDGCETVIERIKRGIERLYNVFEHTLAVFEDEGYFRTAGNKWFQGDVSHDEDSSPWYVKWKLDCDRLCTDFDVRLNKMTDEGRIKWLPWVGDQYKENRIMVVCESNYAEPKWCRWVDSHGDFTRLVSDYLCIKRIDKVKGRTLPTIARMLMNNYEDSIPDVWGRIAFMDVVQRCLKDEGRKKERPNAEDVQTGWLSVIAVAKVLEPNFILVAGANRALNGLPNIRCSCPSCCKITEDHSHGVVGSVPVLFVPHPMSRGFSYCEWRDQLKESIPQLYGKVK